MHLDLLVALFNKRFQLERGIHEAPLRVVRGKVEGRVGELRLTSTLKPIRLAESPLIVQGHEAVLHAYVEGGSPQAAMDVFGDAEGVSVVNMDRLCRTVHMLNYLPYAWNDGFLSVEVNPRHVLSIKQNHGAYFEEVLGRCGLTPKQVVISVPFEHLSNSYQLALVQGLNNYRSRGYQLAVRLSQTHPEQIKQSTVLVTRLSPDFVKLQRPFLTDRNGQAASALQLELTRKLVSIARLAGGLTIQNGIETEQDLETARSLKAYLLEGDYFGQPVKRRARDAA
ncbi:EAL domain-containing protein [Methylogaea oryzae]|uniref:EAL domain-containing protein n=1 Tax=Methylogaea oryzae TaxID=1295382 RepID=A0A8D5AKQ4_9GAMM|nr:EAL domain-containing protein [Methylogaea oryzae]BBL71371.1 hypothetical protein MoryE10_19770 [Methylogaea oryzae]